MGDAFDIRIYEDLRERLVDRTRRNRLLHFKHSARAKIIRIVDEVPDRVLSHLQNDGRFRFRPLPDPGDDLRDEQTPEFRAALATTRVTDKDYRAAMAGLDQDDPSTSAKEERIERELRDKIREQLGLPHRASRKAINIIEYARTCGIDPNFDLQPLQSNSAQRRRDDWLQTLLFNEKLQGRLLGILRDARAVEHETGVSTLHLAFGFLEWFEADTSEIAFSTPLLLLPVELERVTTRGREDEFRVAASENDPITNLSLELRLREERLSLPAFDPERPNPIENYLGEVADAIKRFPRWRIRRFITMAPFSFARIAMYRDLAQENWTSLKGGPTAHALVYPLIRGSSDVFTSSDATFAEEYETDRPEIARIAPILVHDADSSQHSAIIDAMKGRSLIIEGPPGTGKSQTIANLIANAIYQGRTVLFVSEKMAALDVVKSRLDRVGLGHFCLPLHAAGAKPATVMEALRRRLALRSEPVQQDTAAQAQIQRACTGLANHLEAMHSSVGPDQETVHALIGRMAELGRVLPQLPPVLRPKGAEIRCPVEAAGMLVARESLELFEATLSDSALADWEPTASPFRILGRFDLFPDEQARLLSLLSQLASYCTSLMSAWEQLSSQLDERPSCSLGEIVDVAERVARLGGPPSVADGRLLSAFCNRSDVALGSRLADAMVEAHELRDALEICGVGNPIPDRMFKAARAATDLGLSADHADDVAEKLEGASACAADLSEQSETVLALADLFDLGVDPEVGTLRLACIAAGLAAEVGSDTAAFRRPGLEAHVARLESAALRQEEAERRLYDMGERIDLASASAGAIRRAATTLRGSGLFSFLNSEFRDAKRTFVKHWRGGRLPPRSRWAGHLDAAASVLTEVSSLQNDLRLREITGKEYEPGHFRFRDFAAAARWQQCTLARLSHEGAAGVGLHSTLVALDSSLVRRLTLLASKAASTLTALTDIDPPAGERWSSLMQSAVKRQEDLSEIASILADVGIGHHVELGRMADLAETAVRLQSAEATIALVSAQLSISSPLPAAGAIRAAIDFASLVQNALPKVAPALLQDGWTTTIKAVRDSTAHVVGILEKVRQTLTQLKPLGLALLASDAKALTPYEILTSTSALVDSCDELPAYLRYASARRVVLRIPLLRLS